MDSKKKNHLRDEDNEEFNLINYIDKKFSDFEQLITIQNKSILNIDEAAKFLGISKGYLYQLTSLGKIPHTKPLGKLIKFDRLELENWMRQNKTGSL